MSPIPPTAKSQKSTCRKRCPGGGECVCDGNIDHWFCICKAVGCYCHSRTRYDEERTPHTTKPAPRRMPPVTVRADGQGNGARSLTMARQVATAMGGGGET